MHACDQNNIKNYIYIYIYYYLDYAVMEEISDPRNSSVFVFDVEFGYLVFDDLFSSGATFFVVTKLNVTFS